MKRSIFPSLVLLISVASQAASAAEPAPIPWLLQFFSHQATPVPGCKDLSACTAEEQSARDEANAIRYDVANAATEVAYDPAEPPLFRGPRGRARTALRLAVISAHETGLQAKYARSCRPDRGGPACGVGQVHPGAYGLRFTGTTMAQCHSPDVDCFQAIDLLADPVLMQRMMLHILRAGGLPLYTGEGHVEGDASITIRDWESAWWRSHPILADDEDVIDALEEDGLP